MWMYIRGGFENKRAFHIRKKEDRTYIDSDYGPSILLRPKAIKDGLKRRGARIGIDLPLQDGTSFGLRIDRDEYTQSMTIDYGNLEIYHALAIAGYIFHLGELTPPHDPYRRISFFNAEMIEKKGESDEGVPLSLKNKATYVISAIMSTVTPMLTRIGRVGQSVSYHSRENIAKEEYYDNFSHIVANIQGAFENRKKR